MVDIDMTNSGAGSVLGYGKPSGLKLEKTIDIADVLAKSVADGNGALAQGDIFAVFDIPIKYYIESFTVHPIRAAGDATGTAVAVCTFDLGYTSNADVYVNGFDATQIATDAVPIFTNQLYVIAAATSILECEIKTLTGTLATGLFKFVANIRDMS